MLFVGLILTVTPWVMPKTECFTVTIPHGACLFADSTSAGMIRDDDEYWLLGVIYCNREDPSIFVPKRFGIRWTSNIDPWEVRAPS